MSNLHNNLEEYVKNMYTAINVSDRGDLRPDVIINRLGYSLQYVQACSMRIDRTIYLDDRLPQNAKWQEFGRLLCHLLMHQENQLRSAPGLTKLQEVDAMEFAYYVCVPKNMMPPINADETPLQASHRLSKLFNVTPTFASERLRRV